MFMSHHQNARQRDDMEVAITAFENVVRLKSGIENLLNIW
jgi:hypothetical protein